MSVDPGHQPVLIEEVLHALVPQLGQIFVDCTLGRGGHTAAIAPLLGPTGQIISMDVDRANQEFARERLANSPCPIRFFHANFAELPDVLAAAEVQHVDLILADLGLSTNQFLDERYGMSFDKSGPLDMRIDERLPHSAADLIAKLPEEQLANVLYELAQERFSRRIARKIVAARRLSPITTTGQLAELVRSVVPRRRNDKIDPATRTFLALRMAVNREMENLDELLAKAPHCLRPGGRLAVISFQSMEDRRVKTAFRSAEQTGLLELLTRKPLCPTEAELTGNPRSRSAKLRAAKKL
ncbi:MAG: 16S rRNA (cytosine(1402)-N(4))-methyltransferase RsmH [Phycisphaerae bacterium]|nr:16S rRNA (cytosine(1402)-N(4))-methyltransferase RsmH [Phycisphaerae bacterium]